MALLLSLLHLRCSVASCLILRCFSAASSWCCLSRIDIQYVHTYTHTYIHTVAAACMKVLYLTRHCYREYQSTTTLQPNTRTCITVCFYSTHSNVLGVHASPCEGFSMLNVCTNSCTLCLLTPTAPTTTHQHQHTHGTN